VNTDVLISWLRILGTGFVVTMQVSALTLIFSVILAAILAMLSVSPSRPLRFLAGAYVDLLRSIPILALAISVYFGLGATLNQLGITPFGTAVLVLTAIESAYLAELYRGSLEAIRRPQWDAAASLGLGWTRTVWYVILPQALPPAVPITLNMAIAIIKDSSLVSLIAVSEVTLVANQLIAETFEPVPVYLLAALLYVLLIIPLSQVSRRVEAVVARRLGLQPRTDRKLQRLNIQAEARAG
jgi:His/Glu/Gln/Arg/opine family amino acid ABC transporter permease subunit